MILSIPDAYDLQRVFPVLLCSGRRVSVQPGVVNASVGVGVTWYRSWTKNCLQPAGSLSQKRAFPLLLCSEMSAALVRLVVVSVSDGAEAILFGPWMKDCYHRVELLTVSALARHII